MSSNPLAFHTHEVILRKVATIVGSKILENYNKNFRADDFTALEEHYSGSVLEITAGAYEHGDTPFYIEAKLYKTAGKKSERAMIYRLSLSAFSQFSVGTPRLMNADIHLAIAQHNVQGTGKPGSPHELIQFRFTSHPNTAAFVGDIFQDSVVGIEFDAEENTNPLAKDLARQILLHVGL